MTRVSAFIDGFNLYHAILATGQNHLKWANLRQLCEVFAPRPQFDLGDVFFFTAYAPWRQASYARHREFVQALASVGVTTVLGEFKKKDRECFACGSRWTDHEEKETDVNIAIHLLNEARRGSFERALIVSGDSDLAPAVRMLRSEFPGKQVRVITPVGRRSSKELGIAAGDLSFCRLMKVTHLERSLFGATVLGSDSSVVASRPPAYDPPLAPPATP